MKQKHNYTSLLALATQYKNFKRGKKFRGAYSIRLKPGDDTAVEAGYWYKGYHSWKAEDTYIGRRFDKEDQPFITLVTLYPDRAILTNQCQYDEGLCIRLTPELQAKYPHYEPRTWRQNYVDIGFNNLLNWLGLPLDHTGTRNAHPGFNWLVLEPGQPVYTARSKNPKTAIYGPVWYDYATRTVHPATAQPERIVDVEQRRHISTTLRKAYKTLRLFSRMGVTISREEFRGHLCPEGNRNRVADEDLTAFDLKLKQLHDPQALLTLLETVDFTERDQVLELLARCASMHLRRSYLASTTYANADNLYNQLTDGGLSEGDLTTIRRVLHKAFAVERYEM
jgi:hypothetical protein